MIFKSLNLIKNLFFFSIFSFAIFLIITNINILKNFNENIPKIKLINDIKLKDNINKTKNIKLKDLNINKNFTNIKNITTTPKIHKIIIVKDNDTFSKILKPFVKENNFRHEIIKAINTKINLKNLKVNQKIIFYFDVNEYVEKIIIPVDSYNELVIQLDKKNIKVFNKKVEFIKENKSLEFIINSSLYEDGIKAGLPLNVLIKAIKLYSFDIDFQRDIKKDTIFQISYVKLLDEKKNKISYGNIEYINLIIEKKQLEYFIFKTNDGFLDFFNKEGKNVKKSLLKTPIDGARLSSSFGLRKHPISGFNKLHKGVDFAAPKGTPIYAGGNGVIEYKGKNGGYGNYIRIRHNNEYKTAYAHLLSFEKSITKGKRVNQGDIIGYVGSTGNSTGPHLHYEIIYQNKQINPMKMKLPSGKILKKEELASFKKEANQIYAKYLYNLYE